VSIEPGNEVSLAYVGRFEDGDVFTTSDEAVAREHGLIEMRDDETFTPLTFTVGEGDVIEGLEEAVVGLDVGDQRTVTVPPEEAYGEYDQDRVREYDHEAFEAMVGQSPEIGLHVEAQNGLHGDVTAVADDSVQIDFNHELAGKTLVFDIEVLAVR